MKSLIFLLIISSIFANLTDADLFPKFQQFIKKYNKHYDSIEEYLQRFNIFKSHLSTLESKKASQMNHCIIL